jgi:hypothetical protein
MIYVAMAIGAFYVFAGFFVMRAMTMDRLMDRMLAALNSPSDAADVLRTRILSVGAYLTLASGAALAILSPLAVAVFAANIVVQGGYLLWAARALPPQDADEAKGRQQTTNAFVIYLAASAFVGWLAFQGQLRDLTIEAIAIDAAIVAAVVLAAYAIIHLPKSSPQTSPFEPIPLEESDESEVRAPSWQPPSSPPTRLRLAPEWQCHPLWDVDTGESVNPITLGLSEELSFRIEEWDDNFQATFNENDPATSDFASDEARAAYLAEGRAIAAALQDEWPGELDIADEFRPSVS